MADEIKVDTAVTLELHMQNVKAIDGFDEEADKYLAPVVTIFDAAYQTIGDIHKARKQAERNPGWTDAQRILQLAKLGEAQQDKLTKKWDSVYQNLTKQIEALESQFSAPMKAAAERPGIANEIRQHMKSLSNEGRLSLLNDAQKRGDVETLQAVLGAPAYLSGMTEEMRAIRTRMYHEAKAPDAAKRLRISQKAAEMMETRSHYIGTEITKAIGADWAKVKRLREAQDAAEQAFIVKDRTVALGV